MTMLLPHSFMLQSFLLLTCVIHPMKATGQELSHIIVSIISRINMYIMFDVTLIFQYYRLKMNTYLKLCFQRYSAAHNNYYH